MNKSKYFDDFEYFELIGGKVNLLRWLQLFVMQTFNSQNIIDAIDELVAFQSSAVPNSGSTVFGRIRIVAKGRFQFIAPLVQ